MLSYSLQYRSIIRSTLSTIPVSEFDIRESLTTAELIWSLVEAIFIKTHGMWTSLKREKVQVILFSDDKYFKYRVKVEVSKSQDNFHSFSFSLDFDHLLFKFHSTISIYYTSMGLSLRFIYCG